MTIPTYFSHSYRLSDQKLNRAIWHVFAQRGFSFFVDPPSDTTIHAHLERMMRRCSAFVGVVNLRLDGSPNFCSPFVLYEFGLATQARRPQLLLIDKDVDAAQFDNVAEMQKMFFSQQFPGSEQDELATKVDQLRRDAENFPNWSRRPRGRIAVMVPRDRVSCTYAEPDLLDRMRLAARRSGFFVDVVEVPHQHNAHLALTLDQHEAIILDVRGQDLPEWVFPYAYGRLVPTIKLARLAAGEYPDSLVLPPLVQGLRMDEREPCVESVTFWRDPDDLIWQLDRAFQKLNEPRAEFKAGDEGEVYFEGIGRRPAQVFLSNAGAANDFARQVYQALLIRGIKCFHYDTLDAIEPGTDWKHKIRTELRNCDVFIALIGDGYAKSTYCTLEMDEALARLPELILLPFRIGKADVDFMGSTEAAPLPPDAGEAVGYITETLRKRLTDGPSANASLRGVPLLGGSREIIIDAIRHISTRDWPTFVDRMQVADVGVATRADQTIGSREAAETIYASVLRATAGATEATKSLVSAVKSLMPQERNKPLNDILARLDRAGNIG